MEWNFWLSVLLIVVLDVPAFLFMAESLLPSVYLQYKLLREDFQCFYLTAKIRNFVFKGYLIILLHLQETAIGALGKSYK